MATTVVGLYDTETTAKKAAKALKDAGFGDDRLYVEARGAHESGFTRDGDLFGTLTEVGVPRDDAEFYAEGVRRGGSLLILEVDESKANKAAEVMNLHEPVVREEREAYWREEGYTGYDADADYYTDEEVSRERDHYTESLKDEDYRERLREARETLRVGKREVESGAVHIHKRVETRPVEETVHLREEEVDVERRATSGGKVTDDLFEEKTIELTERREEAVVEKDVEVTGEVVATKTARDRTETIRETLREVHIDVDRTADTDAYRGARTDFRTHYDKTYADADDAYEVYEPAYRYGYAHGEHETYQDYDYADVETHLRTDYEKRHGEGTFERVKDAIRHGYTSARSAVS